MPSVLADGGNTQYPAPFSGLTLTEMTSCSSRRRVRALRASSVSPSISKCSARSIVVTPVSVMTSTPLATRLPNISLD